MDSLSGALCFLTYKTIYQTYVFANFSMTICSRFEVCCEVFYTQEFLLDTAFDRAVLQDKKHSSIVDDVTRSRECER